MKPSSPLEKALSDFPRRTGWLLKSLGHSPFDNVNPWHAELYAGHFGGSYFSGTPERQGQWTIIRNAMSTVNADGATALQALQNALAALDKSDLKAVYEDLERAFEDWLDAIQATGNSS